MRIIDAMTLRDGGTTCVTVEDNGVVKHVTFDYSLPWDGRDRYIYISKSKFGLDESDRLVQNSDEEIRMIYAIREAALEKFGPTTVETLFNNSETNPGEEIWFYVFNFLRIAINERNVS